MSELIITHRTIHHQCSYNGETFGYGIYGNNTWAPDQHGAVPSCANKYLLDDLLRGEWG